MGFFNGRFRNEVLNSEIAHTLAGAKVLIDRRQLEFNEIRPRNSLGKRPPALEVITPSPPGEAEGRQAEWAFGPT